MSRNFTCIKNRHVSLYTVGQCWYPARLIGWPHIAVICSAETQTFEENAILDSDSIGQLILVITQRISIARIPEHQAVFILIASHFSELSQSLHWVWALTGAVALDHCLLQVLVTAAFRALNLSWMIYSALAIMSDRAWASLSDPKLTKLSVWSYWQMIEAVASSSTHLMTHQWRGLIALSTCSAGFCRCSEEQSFDFAHFRLSSWLTKEAPYYSQQLR